MQNKTNKKRLFLLGTSFALMSLASVSASAAPLVWTTGVWGDTWQSVVTSGTDSDGDGVPNTQDIFPNDIGEWGDFDEDGLGDFADLDDDNDGILDHPDPDDDNDGLLDVTEVTLGSNPLKTDSDGDGMADGPEVVAGRNPVLNEPAVIVNILNIE